MIRWPCFAEAVHGVRLMLRTQRNARVHGVATLAVGALGWWLRLAPAEWAALVVAVALVWVAEALNTAIELVVDLVSPERRQLAGWAKDVAAGAVLLAALGAVAIGLLIFGPGLLAKLHTATIHA